MGTRHLIAVKLDGEYKIAQYGQWDGYPEGQGKTVLKFLKEWNREVFEEKLRACSFLDDDGIKAINEAIEKAGLRGNWQSRYPELSRDAGADILAMVQASESGLKLKNDIEFAADSLFCEFAYVIDLDANVLEVFTGFNKSPLEPGERFFGAAIGDEKAAKRRVGDGYHPVKLAASYPLDDLPSVGKMKRDCCRDEEEE